MRGSISEDVFLASYLKPLQDKSAPVLVAFLVDKLGVSDITKYADVYNPKSDGGAFQNIKSQMDDDFSLELPHVDNPHMALNSLRHRFPGNVLDLSHTSDLNNLDLQCSGSFLVIVSLKPVAAAANKETIFTANDELIGKLSGVLEKQKVKYTALFTAESSHSDWPETQTTPPTRHLLEAPEGNKSDGFFNASYGNGSVLAYLKSVSVCLRPAFDENKPPLTFCPVNFTVTNLNASRMTARQEGNRTVSLNLTITNIQPKTSTAIFNFTLTMCFQHQYDRWQIHDSSVTITNSTGGSMVTALRLVTRGYDPVVPLTLSFHCTAMKWIPANLSSPTLPFISLGGFQVQPFHSPPWGFSPSQDCVGWFTAPIWMGLVAAGLHLFILLLGFKMLLNVTTNRRYDDPKSKALTFSTAE